MASAGKLCINTCLYSVRYALILGINEFGMRFVVVASLNAPVPTLRPAPILRPPCVVIMVIFDCCFDNQIMTQIMSFESKF